MSQQVGMLEIEILPEAGGSFKVRCALMPLGGGISTSAVSKQDLETLVTYIEAVVGKHRKHK